MAANQGGGRCGEAEGPHGLPAVALEVEFNRPHLALEVCGADGSWQPALAWVDTGGGSLLIGEHLARRLGLSTGPELDTRSDDRRLAPLQTLPRVRCCRRELQPIPGQAYAVVGAERADHGQRAEMFLPAHMLVGHRLILDYPRNAGSLLSSVDSRALTGRPVPCQPPAASGFPRTHVEIAGETLGLLVDTGAPCSMISAAVLDRWEATGFPVTTGAAGVEAMGTTKDPQARMVRVPELYWGDLGLHDVLFVERPLGTFENWMSQLIGGPVVGALAGNVFTHCRLDLTLGDDTRLLVDCTTTSLGGDLRTVGLSWRRQNSALFVQGVSLRAADETKAAVSVGDELVAIDGQPTAEMTNHEVTTALSGHIGTSKDLVLRRADSTGTAQNLPTAGGDAECCSPSESRLLSVRVPVVDLL